MRIKTSLLCTAAIVQFGIIAGCEPGSEDGKDESGTGSVTVEKSDSTAGSATAPKDESKGGGATAQKSESKAGGVIVLSDGTFARAIEKGVTLVDFWAPWCAPCRIQGPIVKRVAEQIGGRAKIAKMNVDRNRQTAARFRINAIPTLIVFKDGEPFRQLVGVQQEEDLIAAIKAALGSGS
jgi:thioredoxin 1